MSNIEDDQPFTPAKTKKISALVRNAIKVQEQTLIRDAEITRKAEEREAEEREAEEREAEEREVKTQLQIKSSTHSSVKTPTAVQASSSTKAKAMSTPDKKRGTSTGPAPLLSTTSPIPTGRTCPGCYHCNWTGVSVDNYGCALTYYGSQQ